MKINQTLVKQRLGSVDPKNRVYIYDGSIIIEFFRSSFMPMQYFFPNLVVKAGEPITKSKEFKDAAKDHHMSMRDLYQLYVLWREEKDYTKKIESRYVFSLITRHLKMYQNGWEQYVYRVGRDQIWHSGPLVLRTSTVIGQPEPAKPEPVSADQASVPVNPVQEEVSEEELDAAIDQQEEINKIGRSIADKDAAELLNGGTSTTFIQTNPPPPELPGY